jgi:hypothetical protein
MAAVLPMLVRWWISPRSKSAMPAKTVSTIRPAARERVAMEPGLEDALRVAFGATTPEGGRMEHLPSAVDLVQARQRLDAAEAALRDGDWAQFGAAMQDLKLLLGPRAGDGL